jgi:hypothetical protein
MKKVRLNVYLKPETLEEIKLLADKMSTTQTAVAAMAIQAGMDALKMALNPDFHKLFDEVNIDDLATNRRSSTK